MQRFCLQRVCLYFIYATYTTLRIISYPFSLMIVKFSGASNEDLNRTPLILPNTFNKIKDLFIFISREHPETRESFFEIDGRVKDGTLVIVDDQDWELLGSEEYELQGEDIILISSLHGG